MIYFMRAGQDGPVKIGWTRDQESLEERRRTLQTGQPYRLAVIRILHANRGAEAWLHGFFTAFRLMGEWFEYDDRMLSVSPPEPNQARLIRRDPNQRMTGLQLRDAIRGIDRTAREVAAHLEMREETISRMVNGQHPVPRYVDLLFEQWQSQAPINLPPRRIGE